MSKKPISSREFIEEHPVPTPKSVAEAMGETWKTAPEAVEAEEEVDGAAVEAEMSGNVTDESTEKGPSEKKTGKM